MSVTTNPAAKYLEVAPVIRIGFLVVGLFVLVLGVWSGAAGLSGAVIATGVVVPEGKRKTIQHPAVGVIESIFVAEGEMVQSGQPLLKLDEVQNRALYDSLHNQYLAVRAQEIRLVAEMHRLSTIPEPHDSDLEVHLFLEQEQRFFESRRKSREGQEILLRDRVHQLQEEIGGITELLGASQRQLVLTREEKASVQTLAEKGYAPKLKLLQYDRSLAHLEGEIGSHRSEIAKARQKISETENEIIQLDKEFNERHSHELREVQVKLKDLEPRLAAARHNLDQVVIVSPVTGHVLDLAVSTIGGMVEPGKPLMDIVPMESAPVISTQVLPQDIEEVYVGQKGDVHMAGRPGGNTMPMKVTVTMVSADRLTDQRTGMPYYSAKIRIDPGEADKILPARLIPGMAMEVVLPVHERTLFEYLIDPLRQRIRKAMRER